MHSNLLAAAITGLVLGASSLARAQTTAGARAQLGSDDIQQLDTSEAGAKHGCKGQGGCKTDSPKSDKNSCAGKGGCGTK